MINFKRFNNISNTYNFLFSFFFHFHSSIQRMCGSMEDDNTLVFLFQFTRKTILLNVIKVFFKTIFKFISIYSFLFFVWSPKCRLIRCLDNKFHCIKTVIFFFCQEIRQLLKRWTKALENNGRLFPRKTDVTMDFINK